MRLLVWVGQPVASVLAGWAGTRLGLHTAIWCAAAGALIAPVPLLAVRLAADQPPGEPGPAQAA